jgi:hypothetical protein
MTLGSYQPYAEPRDEAKMMKIPKSGLFPKVGPSHEKIMTKQLEKIRKGMDINMVRTRRIEQDTRMNHQLETDRLHEVLRANRIPGLRGAMQGRMNADRVAADIN